MKLVNKSIEEFVNLMGSAAPAPGGGSAAGLCGAQGIALTAMVCALTIGKKKYTEFEHEAVLAEKKASAMKRQFTDLIDRDTEAFNAVSAVFAMPKDTDEDKAARKTAMQEALKGCTLVPMEMMELSLDALVLTKSLIGRSNATAVSDLGCAALNLKTAIQSSWLNVLINISSIHDDAFVTEYRGRGETVLAVALPLADEIYETVKNSL